MSSSSLLLSGGDVRLFWAEPMTGDSETGSEDPLALDYLGQRVGNEIFPRFTTRTNRAWYYAVILYGLDLVDRAIEKYGLPGSDDKRVRLFERWERFWAMATVASRSEGMVRGDPDAMRGIEGAKRLWAKHGQRASIPIDPPEYHLISRQMELGGLGAYLSSLRTCGLVPKGSLRVGTAAHDIIKDFWGSVAKGEYDAYALAVLDPRLSVVDRTFGRLSIEGVGRSSRLTALGEPDRTAMRERIYDALILSNARDASGRLDDTTAPLTRLIERAVRAGWSGDSRSWFRRALNGSWGRVEDHLKPSLEGCLQFGDISQVLMDAFNDLYRLCMEGGTQIGVKKASSDGIAPHLGELHTRARAFLDGPAVRWLRGYESHTAGFLDLVTVCNGGSQSNILDAILRYHTRVQNDRGRGGGWLTADEGKILVLDAGYTGFEKRAEFPDLKVSTVRSLLSDLGRLAQ